MILKYEPLREKGGPTGNGGRAYSEGLGGPCIRLYSLAVASMGQWLGHHPEAC